MGTVGERLAYRLLFGLVLDGHRSHLLGDDVFHGIHRFITIGCLQRVAWIETGKLGDVTIDAVALAELDVVDLEEWHPHEGIARASGAKLLKANSVVFKGDAAEVQGKPRGLRPTPVDVEIGQLQVGHGGTLGRNGPASLRQPRVSSASVDMMPYEIEASLLPDRVQLA